MLVVTDLLTSFTVARHVA